MQVDTDENDTRHVKGSQRVTPPKADHKHEYHRIIAWNFVRRFDGSISEKKYKFSLPATCIDCGHVNRKAYKDAIEVEVPPQEMKRIRESKK